METNVARYIDHAVLKPEMSREEAKKAILEGVKFSVRTVCVRPCDIDLAVDLCKGSQTEVSCTLGFPHGDGMTEVKAYEASLYVKKGITEIDMVANYGYIRSGLWDLVLSDIKAVADITKQAGVLLKVIFETCTLSDEEIKKTTEICIEAGADFVKTSTGFHNKGATDEAVKAMIEAAKGRIKVKASGGIRDLETAKKYLDFGCERLGVGYSTTPVLVSGEGQSKEAY
ncbi:MAG: deoxyribose-phosphate aldolase [Acetivibrionales bacterium]|jgi:deoxyribose-phosphate aldolase|nr:deoxyribose-phosphate aldolase [Clostridiaceae bacterium]